MTAKDWVLSQPWRLLDSNITAAPPPNTLLPATMPRLRPHLSITLPKNFTYHSDGSEAPKTPDSKPPLHVPPPPHAERPYRLKRRSRPTVAALFPDGSPSITPSNDTPIPSIEYTTLDSTVRPPLRSSGSLGTALGSSIAPKASRSPRTPDPPGRPSISSWMVTQDLGQSISRPLSRCSIVSDSSDDSAGSLTSYPAGGGSCTSPESEAPGFRFSSIRKGKVSDKVSTLDYGNDLDGARPALPSIIRWTPEMDRHLWSTYLLYIHDPTVTPFKMLPGCAPPLGVCHRVARQAKKTWRGAKARHLTPPSLQSPGSFRSNCGRGSHSGGLGSPATPRASHNGGITPTGRPSTWPKSGSSTRRRLRHLCKSQTSIAPHYQRLLQCRSPSPFSSSVRSQSRSQSQLSEISSRLTPAHSAFNTRDVQLSLTTSTADTMQPDGPLARLSGIDAIFQTYDSNKSEEFNEPPVPFASDIPIPSELNAPVDVTHEQPSSADPEMPRLGSPFAFHTWGPSQSRQRLRPQAQKTPSSDIATIGPSLRSPLQLQDLPSHSSIYKRRAGFALENEVSPSGSNVPESMLDDSFKILTERHHRRVRSRGFSLGDINQHPLRSLFDVPREGIDGHIPTESVGASKPVQQVNNLFEPITPNTNEVRPLDSPFSGISARPTRKPMRHLATTSLGAYDPRSYTSIGQALADSATSRALNGQ